MAGSSLPRPVRALIFCLVLGACLHPGSAQEPVSPSVPTPPAPKLAEAQAKAVAWIIAHQSQAGFLSDMPDDKKGAAEEPPYCANVMTAFSLMALASAGHFPSAATLEGKAAARGLAYVLTNLGPEDQGYLGKWDRSRMYGQGIITLMLVRLLPHAPDEATRLRMQAYIGHAIDFCVTAQAVVKNEHHTGGWRYEPNSSDSDTSVTTWQMMALLEAKKAGLAVPQDSLDKGLAYMQRAYRHRRDAAGRIISGIFPYESNGYFSKFRHGTRAGLLVLQAAGLHDSDQARRALASLTNFDFLPPPQPGAFFYYGGYYHAHALFHSGGPHAALAREWLEKTLLPLQTPEGSWTPTGNEKNCGTFYATALALLSLGAEPAAAGR